MTARDTLRAVAEAHDWTRALDAGPFADTFRKGLTFIHVRYSERNGVTLVETPFRRYTGTDRVGWAAELLKTI
jgi:hypothetical protein